MKATDLWTIKPLARPESVVCGPGYRITVLTDRLLRLEYEADNRFEDSATQMAICREFPAVPFTSAVQDGRLVIDTESLHLEYDQKPFSSTGLSVTLKGSFTVYASIWHYGDQDESFGGTARTLDMADGEIPLESSIMSPKGYAVLDDSRSMRMDNEGKLQPHVPHGEDLYLFAYGHDYHGCLRDYLHLSGPAPVIPRFALGNWWSRFYPYTQQSYQELMEKFHEEGVPLSVSVLDMNWHVTDIDPKYGTGWTGYSWDREKFPEPEKLLKWLHEYGLKVTLNDHPADGIRPCEDMYENMARELGVDPAEERSFPFDAASETYLKALDKAVLEPHEESGVDFWWLDWQQKGGTSDPGMDPLFVLNHTRFLHALDTGRAPMILSRYGGPGSHRYPLGFSGDTAATWDSLKFQPFFTSAAANIAYGWWSHDIGGHMFGAKDDELTARWVQFGAFSPILRLHSSTSMFMRKEPWLFSHEASEAMKKYLRLRHRMIPWLYSQNVIASRENKAHLRPLYYDYNDRMFHYVRRNEYLLGDCMFVSPIVKRADPKTGLAAVNTWLPKGDWTDLMTGDRYHGGRMLNLYRSLSDIPVLVKAGGIVPMDAEDVPENGVELPDTILLRVFTGADGECELIEDNGKLPCDPEYRSVITRVKLEGSTLTVFPPEGDASLLPAGRRYLVEMNGFANVEPEADCTIGCSYDENRRALTVELSALSAVLRWTGDTSAPAIDWPERLMNLLTPVEMSFNDKERLVWAARGCRTPVEFLAQAHMMDLAPSLLGAILELLSAY